MVAVSIPVSHPNIILTVDNLSVESKRNGETYYALRNIQLKLAEGEIIGLVGESGAGKSLLLKSLVNQLPAGFQRTADAIHFFPQKNIAKREPLLGKEVTFIPQDPMNALNPGLTVLQHFQDQFSGYGLTRKQIRQKVLDSLNDMSLPHPENLLQRYAHQLSGGMAQRILIALAFITEPRLVICDEATTALDAINQQRVVALLKKMQQRFSTSVLFVTHDLAFVAQHCHRLLVMYAGEIVETGSASEVMASPGHPYTQSLLASRPTLTPEWHILPEIRGHMPSPGPSKDFACCRFAPRCAYQQPLCSSQAPAFSQENEARVRCHFVGQLLPQEQGEEVSQHNALHKMLPGNGIPFLYLEGVGKSYAVRQRFRTAHKAVLSDLNFTVSPGEFIGLLGESGSGKSTLARLLIGLEPASQGVIRLNGHLLPQSKYADAGTVQMIFQNNFQALNPYRTVANLLTQGMENGPYLHSERQRRAEELAELVGLPLKLLESYPPQLSGGQRQRVNIGRALCTMPQLLIADEIVSGLDVSVQARILNLLLTLRQTQKFALILISHDLAVVNYLCHRVMVLHEGKIVEQGPVQDVLHRPQNPWTQALINASQT